MPQEQPAKYVAPNLKVAILEPIPFHERKSHLRAAELEKKIEENDAYIAQLATIQIEDAVSQRSLFAQAISAVHDRLDEKPEISKDFKGYLYLTEPNSQRFLVANVEGNWDVEARTFTLHSILIHQICESLEDLIGMIQAIQTYSPSVPKLGSDSVRAALRKHKETT